MEIPSSVIPKKKANEIPIAGCWERLLYISDGKKIYVRCIK
jgi:hypothetical protein